MIESRHEAKVATEHELAVSHREAVQHGDERERDIIQEEALSRGISIPQLERTR